MEVRDWETGRTGMAFVDAAEREHVCHGPDAQPAAELVRLLFSPNTLMSHWKIGMDWFEDCLIGWDPGQQRHGLASGRRVGPDATPYFRVFNPRLRP